MEPLRDVEEQLRRPIHPGTLVAILFLLCVLGGGLFFGVQAFWLFRAGSGVRNAVESAAAHARSANFSATRADLERAHAAFGELRSIVDAVGVFGARFFFPREYEGTDRMFEITASLLSSGVQMAAAVDDITGPLRGEDEAVISFDRVTPQQKREAFQNLLRATPTLVGTRAHIALASAELKNMDSSSLPDTLQSIQRMLVGKTEQFEQAVEAIAPVMELAPAFLGFPQEKNYLLLLQNTHEVRATGGFIGTYGIVKLHNGSITSLHTDDTYNLERKTPSRPPLVPPKPFPRYFKKLKGWFLRDSNWSPDFGESARTAVFMYNRQGGNEKIDGVIALTPEVFRTLLLVTGPLTVDSVTFTPENAISILQYEVEKGYVQKGIKRTARKDIIGKLAHRLLDEIYHFDTRQLGELANRTQDLFTQKYILLYFQDPALQTYAHTRGWTGIIHDTAGDYIMVVDSNMRSLKTDQVMDKNIDYTVTELPDGRLRAQAVLRYRNKGRYTWLTTDYKDWVRVYVPKGSKLLRTEGAESPEKEGVPAEVEISEEHDKVVFATSFTIKPGEKKTLLFEYDLPERIASQLRVGMYTLFVQKQSGVSDKVLNANFSFQRQPKKATPREFFSQKELFRVTQIHAPTDRDRLYRIDF